MSTNPCLANDSQTALLHTIEVAGYRYVALTICLFGIVCNILNLCVLLQRRLKESPYTYLTGLAIADMLTLISFSPLSIVRGDYIRQKHLLIILMRLATYIYMPLANYFGQVSIMITVALTIERYLFTTYPLRTQSFCKPRYARMIIAIIVLVCAILNLPRVLFSTIEEVIAPVGSLNQSSCATYPFLLDSSSNEQCFCIRLILRDPSGSYQNIYFISMLITNQILPGLLLLLLNWILIQRVQRSNRYTLRELVARQHGHITLPFTPTIPTIKQRRLREEHRLTKTLVAVVVVFLVCNTFTIISYPNFVRKITEKRHPKYYHRGFRIQTLVTNIMLLLNYSINFFFYCAFNHKFMDTLKMTFRHRFCSYSSMRFDQRTDSLTTRRTLLNSAALLAHSSIYSHSRMHHYSKRFSNSEDGSQHINRTRKGFRLKILKDNDVRR